AQGGGVVRAIAAHPDGGFSARAITRDPSSDAAKALAALPNVEVVQADADDEASLERAFAGCHGAFCVTFFWVDYSPEHEMAQARNMAAAAKAAGVRHVIWSTLEDTRRFVTDDRMPTLQGRYKVPHFDGKEEADAAFREAGVPTTFLRTAFSRSRSRWGARAFRAWPPRTSARRRTGSSPAATSWSARRSRSRASI